MVAPCSNLKLPRHREPATASPSSRLCRASFLVHPAATTMVAPPKLAGLPCRARKSQNHGHNHR
ncbi:hypothetical protein DEO72_LG5g2149 [Vigna unguiculata]|uniref:Uncharacterized protein n=1 Tax=Vigna unguiculata TaxID=3917 RepID=A0A4D6M0J7_VIGUN|nr:hypothetical protein DEO72_LG5g2149 [Vigna unguiculata]